MMAEPVYLDYNATTPPAKEVVEAMLPFLETHFGNPSSSHRCGAIAKKAVEDARSRVAALLCCEPSEIVFTSGGTESNNYAIKGIAFALREKGNHLIISPIEHPAVSEVCSYLESHGFEVTRLPVDEHGLVSPVEVEHAITPRTILISIMHANNEVGTVQPISEISAIARGHRIAMHTDAAQSVGKIPVSVASLGVDLLSVAGHKLYAPKGVGALYVKRGLRLEKFLHGASHESGRRAGTENVASIVGLGRACENAGRDLEKNGSHMMRMRDMLHQGLGRELKEMRLNGHPGHRLPNTLSISFRGIDANTLISRIEEHVAVSAGAACHSGKSEISHVLQAMQVPEEWALGTIRFSTGVHTTEKEISRVIPLITAAARMEMAHPSPSR